MIKTDKFSASKNIATSKTVKEASKNIDVTNTGFTGCIVLVF